MFAHLTFCNTGEAHCYWPHLPGIALEGRVRNCGSMARSHGQTGMFLSGGVGSLASLRRDRLNFPVENEVTLVDTVGVFNRS